MKADRIDRWPLALQKIEPRIGAPLFHAAWLFAIGIFIAHSLWLRPAWLLLSLVPLAILSGIAAFRAQRLIWMPVAILWSALGVWCAEMQPQPAPDADLSTLSDGLSRTIEGTIIDAGPVRIESDSEFASGSKEGPTQRVDVRLSSIEFVSDSEDLQRPADAAVRMMVRWTSDAAAPIAFACGQRIRADARLMLPDVYHDPGAWNYRDYLLDQGITSTASVKADGVESFAASANETLFNCQLTTWQHAASARLLALPSTMRRFPVALRISNEDAVMLAAMVTGDRTYLTHSLREGFERTGSFHMLVVSGLHLGIVAGCIFWTTRRIRLPQLPATIITITASCAYALFTGFAAPVQRSLWMVSLYLIGRLVYRQRNVLNTIGFASLCLLASSPRSLFDASLQMTVLAVISIGGIAVPLLEKTVHPYLTATRDLRLLALDVKLPPSQAQFRVLLRMFSFALSRAAGKLIGRTLFPRTVRTFLRCLEALVVSCIVELAMALPMATYFHRITVFALPVNLIILPLLVVLVPSALLTLMTTFISPTIAGVAAVVTAMLLHLAVGLIHLFAVIRTGDYRMPAPLPAQTAAFSVLLGASLLLACLANNWKSRWLRRSACLAILLAAIVVVLPRPIDHPRQALLVEAIDVGQGDSLLLITPDGKTLLVDGGGFGGAPRQTAQNFDIGEEVVSPVLWSRGIRHLDVVALTHAHSDHMGGLPAILHNFKPDELWVGNNPPSLPYIALLDQTQVLNIHVRRMDAGDHTSLGAAEVNVLAPLSNYTPGPEPGNNDSLVLRVSYGRTGVLLEGDAEAPIERAMLADKGLASDLLKVGHHGSATSTQPAFLSLVSPQFAVISCGLHNHYGHPRSEVLQSLQAAHVRTFSTDITGATCFALDGRTVDGLAFCGLQDP
ncbi:ComEC/Rec2 family competence protein [Occallatibacter savannae]|uniref:ComEC/Rec2 family competence protein n=1 Tax=Occallatibacter savannae TaxID=1002691 RepID=UPI000D69AEA2|nr:ComEC/Rec2 family competence protein [Occallatibacter savannae]